MKADISRDTFQAARNIRRVVAQQGRPSLDSDWNEQVTVLLHRLETLAADVFGNYHGVADGFKVEPGTDPSNSHKVLANTFSVGRGRYYLHGLMCENHEQRLFALKPGDTKKCFVYLHAWEEYEAGVEEAAITEPALKGVGTCGRTSVRWSVKCAASADNSWQTFRRNNLPQIPAARLRLRGTEIVDKRDSARTQDRSTYRTVENVLYRVEVHEVKSGEKTPRFKWARDNASTLAAVSREGSSLKVHGAGDLDAAFQPNGWVEIQVRPHHEQQEPTGMPLPIVPIEQEEPRSAMYRIGVVHREDRTIELIDGPTAKVGKGDTLFARPWDGCEPISLGWQRLDASLEVRFEQKDRQLRVGQYWLIAARAEGGGQVYWPEESKSQEVYRWVSLNQLSKREQADSTIGSFGAAPQEPDLSPHYSAFTDTGEPGYLPRHFYGPLAFVVLEDEGTLKITDVRDLPADAKQK